MRYQEYNMRKVELPSSYKRGGPSTKVADKYVSDIFKAEPTQTPKQASEFGCLKKRSEYGNRTEAKDVLSYSNAFAYRDEVSIQLLQ